MKALTAISSVCLIATLMNTSDTYADHRVEYPEYGSSDSDVTVSTFYTYEVSDLDYIAGIGGAITIADKSTNFGFGLTTSLSNAEVLTTDGFIEDYLAWEGTIRLGYFSDVFAYAELGIDLTELTFNDYRDGSDYDHHYHRHDDVDSFIGFGVGIDLGGVKIEGFSRLREIDSQYWEANSTWFSGVQVSINF